jgi:hypothetical protein
MPAAATKTQQPTLAERFIAAHAEMVKLGKLTLIQDKIGDIDEVLRERLRSRGDLP